jgi:phage replication initiation protein
MCIDNSQNIIIYDWLSFVTHEHTPQDIIEFLGLPFDKFILVKGAKGYLHRYYFDSISVHYDGEPNMGVWVEISGQGCRAFETYGTGDYNALFDFIVTSKGAIHITRLDVAFDDHSGLLDISTLCEDTLHQNFISKFRKFEVIQGNCGTTIILGSRKSDCLLRIYDKAMERGKLDEHWIRVELQMRDNNALEYIKKQSQFTAGVMFSLVLNNYIRYVIPSVSDVNKWRWESTEYWQNFVQTSERISIYSKPKVDYNLKRLENYVINQAGNAVDTYIDIMGVDGFLNKLDNRSINPNPKYIELLKKFNVDSGKYNSVPKPKFE